MQLPATGLGEAVEDGKSSWVPAAHMGDKDEAPDCWLELALPWSLRASMGESEDEKSLFLFLLPSFLPLSL